MPGVLQVRRWRSRRLVALKYVFGSLIPCVMMYYVKIRCGVRVVGGSAVCKRVRAHIHTHARARIGTHGGGGGR